ncbi:MAG: phosphotransferase [Planctomycetes bacterium]|nr:phosphotransferase [Planctomycetota bacterium]
MTSFPLPETSLPGLAPLLSGDLWERWAGEGKVPAIAGVRGAVRYLRLKPTSSCRLTIFCGEPALDGAPPLAFLVHLLPDAARAGTLFEKARARAERGPRSSYPPFLSVEPPAVVLPFPIDPELPELAGLYESDRLRRAIAPLLTEFPPAEWRLQKRLIQGELLAYKPGRRAVYRVKVKLRSLARDEKARTYLHVKVGTPEGASRSFANQRGIFGALEAAGAGAGNPAWRVPRPRGLVPDRALVAGEWIDAPRLDRVVAERGAAAANALARAGRALAELHRLELHLDHRPSPPERGETIRELAADLGALLPERRAALSALGARLARAIACFAVAPSCIVHGDFHTAQVLVEKDGVVLVDFDDAGRGYAAEDLGFFLASLDEAHAAPELPRAFLDGYRSVAGGEPREEMIRVATSAAIFARAVFPFRALHGNWPARTGARIDAAEALLQGLDS